MGRVNSTAGLDVPRTPSRKTYVGNYFKFEASASGPSSVFWTDRTLGSGRYLLKQIAVPGARESFVAVCDVLLFKRQPERTR